MCLAVEDVEHYVLSSVSTRGQKLAAGESYPQKRVTRGHKDLSSNVDRHHRGYLIQDGEVLSHHRCHTSDSEKRKIPADATGVKQQQC